MEIVGYSDRLSVAPGERIAFMVSSLRPSYEVQLVRLQHGDENPDGPGVKEFELDSPVGGRRPGRVQPLEPGSHVLVPDDPRLALDGALSIAVFVMPTAPTPHAGAQSLLARWHEEDGSSSGIGYALGLDADGALTLQIGDGAQQAAVSTGVPLTPREWHFVAAVLDPDAGSVRLIQSPLREAILGLGAADVTRPLALTPGDAGRELVLAGHGATAQDGRAVVRGHFNGKLDRPRLFAAALDDHALDRLRAGELPSAAAPVAAWDFAQEIGTVHVRDAGPGAHHGTAINLPMRAVTGANWTGGEVDFRRLPEQYGAIHFHDDDLEDAGWEVDVELTVPADLASGVYALRLRDGEPGGEGAAEEYLPFFVRPPRGGATAEILFLAPTNSYLAYANEHYSWTNEEFATTTFGFGDPLSRLQPGDRFQRDHKLLSIYDRHTDDTGACTSSWRRPIVSLRPKFFMQLIRAPHQFNADLHLIDWLAVKGFRHDVATDHDLHADGLELLRRYRVIVTGSHPEYWTEAMLDALEAYLAGGGRVMYMGGNGFYWVTAIHPELPHVIEVRRGLAGARPWSSAPGECHLACTGEPGGQWWTRGRPPQKLAGVGYTSQGSDVSVPFRRLDDSRDPRAAFVFEGVAEQDVFGDFGLVMGGAGGAEIDRQDALLGTPPHALRLATTTGFSDAYQGSQDDTLFHDSRQGGPVNPRVRADLTLFEGPRDGAVFSTGSIAWCGSLSHDGYENAVSRITENVLRAFSAPGPLPGRD